MNVVVLVKQVPDMNAVKIDRASGKPVLSGQQVVSSYDAYAIEEALRLKERFGGEVTVVAAGPPSVKDAITRALAMGADRGLQIDVSNANDLDTLAVARLLADRVRGLNPDLVLVGQTSDDYETGQVGPQLAELLDLPLVSSVMGLAVEGDRLTLRRDVEDGQQTVETTMPAVLMAITGLNEPRLPSLKGIMAAKRKPLERVEASPEPPGERIAWGEPYVPERGVTGMIVQDVPAAEAAKQLVGWLREQKLI
ncbi:MAG: electron transfer flavoprotein subunit beta/FixA family protein [Chloroflexota bacterium]|nr:electron transfer flavoprotein subunit beta/FixA family protein [Chloroflexota bacterium]